MMTSFVDNIPIIVNLAVFLKPRKILDVGSGFGKFGLLLREALLSNRAENFNEEIPQRTFEIDCVENCKYFIDQPAHRGLYDNHNHQDLFKIPIIDFTAYDLLLMIDVVEHHPKEKVIAWISALLTVNPKMRFLISTPKRTEFYKTHFYGPDCPTHISQWTNLDFSPFGHSYIDSKDSHIIIIQ